MTIRIQLTAGIAALCLSGCLSSRPNSEQELVGVSDAVRATPRYRQAKTFDAFLRNELAPDEKTALFAECRRAPSENVFCPSLQKEATLRRFLRKEEKAAETVMRQKPDPITPELKGKAVKNWGKIQRANLKGLLSGMRAFSLDELKIIGQFALKRAECPNHISIATAALLEIHLPFENVSPLIAQLYEKGARCTRRRTPNHEHYLTRAALFQFLERKYGEAERLLLKVEPSDAYSGRSLYWLYRTRKLLGKTPEAQKTLTRLKSQLPLSFHALMIQASENLDPIAPADPGPIPTRSKDRAANNLVEQAETLREMAFHDSAAKIVAFAMAFRAPPEPGVRAYLSTLGDPPQQIRTVQALIMTRPGLRNQTYLQLAYPKTYFDLFEEYDSQVDPYLLLAIARKESTMDPNAVSPANAQGLLQLNPDTAKRLSRESNLNLFDPRTNAQLAARYMAELKDTMKGQLPLIIASYNAGEQTVATWTQRYPTTDLLLFVDLIPYRETRDYVGYVLSNYFWYRRLYSENAQQALANLANGELAKVEEPRGVRSIKSLIDEALRTSESWPEETGASPFMEKWKEMDSAQEPF